MPLDLNQNHGPIDETDPTFRDVLEELQGNILNGHGRFHSVHFFVNFRGDKTSEAKRWISSFARQRITSAWRQVEQAIAYRERGEDAGIFAHLALSASGYRELQIADDLIPRGADLQNRKANPNSGYSDVFREGMVSRQPVLLDPPQWEFEDEYRDGHKPIHAMVLLAADEAAELIAVERVIAAQLEPIATILAVERGINIKKVFRDEDKPDGVAIEHFGYVDGRSQPLFLKRQADRETANGGGSFWDPRAPLRNLLVPDPGGTATLSFGSFLVYRKLEQNVRAFREAEIAVAQELGLPQALVGAMAVGRFKDGTPVALQPADNVRPIPNDFNYDGDPAGVTCPFHAHIRKTNPRQESVRRGGAFAQSIEEELGHRIARRGVTYGGPLSESKNPQDLPTQGVGLLFFCYQADIWEQFEFMQRFWSNNPNFLQPDFDTSDRNGATPLPEDQRRGSRGYPDATGLDAVIGQRREGQADPAIGCPADAPRHWPRAWGKPPVERVNACFAEFVKLRGGEYFFSPCMSFLKSLDGRS